jgi:hypothetical protein
LRTLSELSSVACPLAFWTAATGAAAAGTASESNAARNGARDTPLPILG